MKQIFNYLDEGIIVCDLKGNILFTNDSILSRLKYCRDEILNMNICNLVSEEDIFTRKLLENLNIYNSKLITIKLNTKEKNIKMFNVNVVRESWKDEEVFYLVMDEAICCGKHTKGDLERILDSIPYSVWVKDDQGKYVYVNENHSKVTGLSKCDILCRDDFDIWNKEDSEYFRNIDKEVLKHKKPILEQHKVFGINNEERWFETYKVPLTNKNNNARYVIGISRDISLSKKIESELERSHKDMVTLNNIAISSDYNAEGVLNSVKDDLINRLKADGVAVWLYDEKNNQLRPELIYGISKMMAESIPEIYIPKAKCLNFSYWPKDGVIPIEERYEIRDKMSLLKSLGVKYSGFYKIAWNNEIIGLIHTVYKEKNDIGMKNDDFMKTMCNQLGMIIKNDILSRDIKKELSKRKELEEELQIFLDTAVDLIAIVGPDKKFKRVNSGWTDLLGWTEEELYTMNSYDIIHPEDIELTNRIVEELQQKLSLRGVINRYVAKNGDVHWIEWSSRYIPDTKISICTGRDITKLRQVEEQREAYEKALALEKVKSEFFANISHEFKTPLNIILTTIQLLMKNIDCGSKSLNEDNIKKYIKSIRQNSYRLLRLVNNLIDITKIDTGYYEIHLENQNIVSVVEDITMSVAEYTEEKGIELIFDTEVEEVITACDPDKIERIILNLLSNAIKYTSSSGTIKVELKIDGEKVLISVSDDGIGIEKEKIDKIFDRFSQVKNTLTRACEGSGIGLSLVKSLIEMHGGCIKVESEFTKGTKFSFQLPIRVLDKGESLVDSKDFISSKVEKCNIEFSDIYN